MKIYLLFLQYYETFNLVVKSLRLMGESTPQGVGGQGGGGGTLHTFMTCVLCIFLQNVLHLTLGFIFSVYV
jgi:hypothetical protein